MTREHRPPRPVGPSELERLALRYVERYATTRGKLVAYLRRKVRERGWEGDAPADPEAIAERFAELGYVDDRAFAEARVAAMGRRGLGARRVAQALRFAGIDAEDAEAVRPAIEEHVTSSAIAFARRRRIGPYAQEAPDARMRERQVAAMVRAGHDPALSWRIAKMAPGEDIASITDDF